MSLEALAGVSKCLRCVKHVTNLSGTVDWFHFLFNFSYSSEGANFAHWLKVRPIGDSTLNVINVKNSSIIVTVVHYQTNFCETTLNVPGLSVHLHGHATCNPVGKYSSHITTQSSPGVTHCILPATQFICSNGMEGRVDLSALGINPDTVGGRSADSAGQTG
jgi:hypothetical protein